MTDNFECMLVSALARDKAFLEETEGYIEEDIFCNQYYCYLFNIVRTYFRASRKLISQNILLHLVKKTAGDVFTQEELPILITAAQNVFESSYDTDFLRTELNDYARTIRTKRALSESLENFNPDNIDNIVKSVAKASESLADDAPLEYISSIGNRELRDEPVETLIPSLDAALDGGIAPGELGLVTAMSSGGKSLLLLNFAWASVIMNRKVLFVTLEDAGDMILKKFDSMFSGMEFRTVKREPSKMLHLKQRFMRHKDLLFVKDYTDSACTIPKLRSLLSHPNMKDLDLLVLDYIDEISCTRHYGDRWQEVEESMRELKKLSLELKLPIWTASQTSAQSWNKENVDLQDTYGGKGKVHVAHIVLVINQTKKEQQDGVLRILVAKQKSGPKGAIIECRTEFKRMRIIDAKG